MTTILIFNGIGSLLGAVGLAFHFAALRRQARRAKVQPLYITNRAR